MFTWEIRIVSRLLYGDQSEQVTSSGVRIHYACFEALSAGPVLIGYPYDGA
jgi:hypothetical protein